MILPSLVPFLFLEIVKELFSLGPFIGSQLALVVKNPPAKAGDIRNLGSVLMFSL